MYPIWETEEESWKRFRRIRELTVKVTGRDFGSNYCDHNIRTCWAKLADYWSDQVRFFGSVNYIVEAIYHIMFRRFSDNVASSSELLLVLLIDDELTRCGFAFSVWSHMSMFKGAYNSVLSAWHRAFDRNRWDFMCYCFYMQYAIEKRIFLKNLHPDIWHSRVSDCADLCGGCISYVWECVEDYEETIRFLIPDADFWQEEWCDPDIIVKRLSELYEVDFTKNLYSLNCLVEAIMHRDNIDACAFRLFRMKISPVQILQNIWDDKFVEKLQQCFVSIFRKYKKSNQNPRGLYRRDRVVQNWMFKQINDWHLSGSIELQHQVKRALLEISIGI
jgi:hypothetical protein